MKSLFAFLLIMIIATGAAIFSQTVTIGTQEWTTKNLDVSTFRNGDTIPEAKTAEEWKKAGENKQPAWCYYNNDTSSRTMYGKLYNWYAVNDPQGLAPAGYHIPSIAEWNVLYDFLGPYAGLKIKSKPIYDTKVRYEDEGGYYETKWVTCNNCSYWTEKQKANNPCTACKNQGGKTIKTGKYIPKTKRKIEEKIQIGGWKIEGGRDGTNESGFSGNPGGERNGYYAAFDRIGENGCWWSSTNKGNGESFYCRLYYNFFHLTTDRSAAFSDGFSVRCLRD